MAQQVTYTWDNDGTANVARNVRCAWSCQSMPKFADSTQYSVVHISVEVLQHNATSSFTGASEHVSFNKHPKLCSLFDAICDTTSDTSNHTVSVTVLLPSFDGYFVRENIIQDRFIDSKVVSAVHSLTNWEEKTAAASPQALSMTKGLAYVIDFGALALIGHKNPSMDLISERHEIENELKYRLQLQWWQHELPLTKTLALVMAGPTWLLYGPVYRAAKANRISLVIIGEPEHWLNDPRHSNLYKHFLPLDLNDDDGQLHVRIVDVVRSSGLVLDGLTSHHDHGIVPVAQAAEILGFPTQPASAYFLSRDKHATHRLRTEGLLCELVTTEEQASAIARDPNVHYPLVVKPQRGFKSDGVTKVSEPSQILPAVRTILSELQDSAVVETYIDGPEIDLNLVLCDGHLLHCEIADNAPCLGDDDAADRSNSHSRPGNFSETGITSPSALPQEELSMAQTAALKAVLAAGYKAGSFHVEGRIMKSSVRYEQVNGQAELQPIPGANPQDARFALIEINARPPGLPVQTAAKRAYGIDHYEHLFFMALNDHERMRTLARPFAFPGLHGAQYWSHLHFPLVTHAGPFDGNLWQSLKASHPQAFQPVSTFETLWADGQEMPDPMTGRSRALGFFIMYARESHRRLLEVVANFQQCLQPTFANGLVRKAESRFSTGPGLSKSPESSLSSRMLEKPLVLSPPVGVA